MDITFKRNDAADTNMTSFHDVEVRGSLEKLTSLFGEPIRDDGKTKHEWILEGSDGTVVTVYDYKYDGAREKYWHVGGKDRIACLKFSRWFNSL